MEKEILICVEHTVEDILKRNYKARNSDNLLFCEVIASIGYKQGIDMAKVSLFNYLVLYSGKKGFPTFETIRRTRQKIQHEHPELLSPDPKVRKKRHQNEEAYREYARS